MTEPAWRGYGARGTEADRMHYVVAAWRAGAPQTYWAPDGVAAPHDSERVRRSHAKHGRPGRHAPYYTIGRFSEWPGCECSKGGAVGCCTRRLAVWTRAVWPCGTRVHTARGVHHRQVKVWLERASRLRPRSIAFSLVLDPADSGHRVRGRKQPDVDRCPSLQTRQ